MMKKIFLVTLFVYTLSWANDFDVNNKLPHFSLPDQFDKIHTINEKITTIIVSFEKDTGAMVNEFLSLQDKSYLSQHHAVFIANISGMPTIITKMFALPKMRDYAHNILLIYDENDKRFSAKEGMSTVYKLNNGVIKEIFYVSSLDEIKQALQ